MTEPPAGWGQPGRPGPQQPPPGPSSPPPGQWGQAPPAKKSGSTAKGCLIAFGIVAAIGVIIIIIVSFAVKDTADKIQRDLQSTTPSGEHVVISLDEYNRIEPGMSKADVEGVIGGPGTQVSQSDIGGFHDEIIRWGGDELGSNATVSFQNDAVQSKAQIGLT